MDDGNSDTQRANQKITEFARHELTTGFAIGPYDLSAELGVCGDMSSPVLRAALHEIRAAAIAAGKPSWMIGSNSAELARDGWRFLCIGETASRF